MRSFFQGTEKNGDEVNGDADANGAVGNIKRGPMPVESVKVQEVHDFAAPDAVNRIADYAAYDNEQCIITFIPAFSKPAHKIKRRNNDGNGNPEQQPAITGHNAPGGAFVGDESNVEKAVNNRNPLAARQVMFDDNFRYLVY